MVNPPPPRQIDLIFRKQQNSLCVLAYLRDFNDLKTSLGEKCIFLSKWEIYVVTEAYVCVVCMCVGGCGCVDLAVAVAVGLEEKWG